MKHSIKKIFKNLNLFLLFSLTMSTIALIFAVEQYNSYNRVEALQKQGDLLEGILLQKKETLDPLQYNATVSQINLINEDILEDIEHDYIAHYIIGNAKELQTNLMQLKKLIHELDQNIRSNKDYSLQKNQESQIQFNNIKNFIDTLILKNIDYDKQKFSIFMKVFIVLFFTLLIIVFWYKHKFTKIYEDILSLQSIQSDMQCYTQEVDAILLRLNRKSPTTNNPSMIDPVTEIHNNKGMLQLYSERKNVKESSFSSLAILEIDNFSKSKRTFSQEFTQVVLKKVAYAISLHQQASDIIARTDYNQFTLIFSRVSKEQLFKDVDLVRQSISEIKLLDPDKAPLRITVTGGFINRSNYGPLDESIRKAKEVLEKGRKLGRDRIIQLKDLPK